MAAQDAEMQEARLLGQQPEEDQAVSMAETGTKG